MNTEEANGVWRRRLPPDLAADIHPVPLDTAKPGAIHQECPAQLHG
jgi:hypothetical protein